MPVSAMIAAGACSTRAKARSISSRSNGPSESSGVERIARVELVRVGGWVGEGLELVGVEIDLHVEVDVDRLLAVG